MRTEWCVRAEDKMSIDMSGVPRYSHFTFPTEARARYALGILLRTHPDAIVMKREVTEWEVA